MKALADCSGSCSMPTTTGAAARSTSAEHVGPVEHPEEQRAQHEERERLAQVPLHPRQRLHEHVAELGDAQRRELEDEVGAAPGDDPRGEPAHQEEHEDDHRREPERGGEGFARSRATRFPASTGEVPETNSTDSIARITSGAPATSAITSQTTSAGAATSRLISTHIDQACQTREGPATTRR